MAFAVALAAWDVVVRADDVVTDAAAAVPLLAVADVALLLVAVGAIATEALPPEEALVLLPAPQALSKDPDKRTPATPTLRKKARRDG